MTFKRSLLAGLLAAIIAGTSSHFAENNDIRIAGILSAIPLSIPLSLIVVENGPYEVWTKSFLVGLTGIRKAFP